MTRLLRFFRPEYRVFCAMNGREAREILDTLEMNVVVTDLRMPHMDGVALLEDVRDRYPACTRIVHSSHIGTADRARLLPLAHRILKKPVEIEQLLGAIDSGVGRQPGSNGGLKTSGGSA
jgi:DNA-binding NtrC family response regulator